MGEGPDSRSEQELTVQQICSKCLDAPGYLVCVAVISPEKDERGHHLINFHYRRYQYDTQDVQLALDKFKGLALDIGDLDAT